MKKSHLCLYLYPLYSIFFFYSLINFLSIIIFTIQLKNAQKVLKGSLSAKTSQNNIASVQALLDTAPSSSVRPLSSTRTYAPRDPSAISKIHHPSPSNAILSIHKKSIESYVPSHDLRTDSAQQDIGRSLVPSRCLSVPSPSACSSLVTATLQAHRSSSSPLSSINKRDVSICQANSAQGDRDVERERDIERETEMARDRDRERAKDRDRVRARVRDRDWERERERDRDRDRIEYSSQELKRHYSTNHPRSRADSDKNSPCTTYLSLASTHTVADRHTEISDPYSRSIPQYTDEDFDLELKRAYEGSSRAVSRIGPKATRSGYHSDGRQGSGYSEDRGRGRGGGGVRQTGLYSG